MFKFEQLDIWKDSIDFAEKIYTIAKRLPRSEYFALSDQLRRSSSSIPANIAEGSGSSSKKDFSHYLDIAIKSTYEVVSHLYLAQKQNYIEESERMAIYQEAEILVKKIKAFQSWLSKTNH